MADTSHSCDECGDEPEGCELRSILPCVCADAVAFGVAFAVVVPVFVCEPGSEAVRRCFLGKGAASSHTERGEGQDVEEPLSLLRRLS